MKKKFFLAVLALLLILCALPATQAHAETYSGTCGENLTWTLDKDTGVLTISGTGEMKGYSRYYSPWYDSRSLIKTVVIEDGVTSIGRNVFYSCYALNGVTIPGSVTSIGESAFYGCDSLTGVYITDIVAWCGIEFDSNDSNPLYYAKNLYLNNELVTGLVIPDSVTSISDVAFLWCTSLTSVTIPGSVTSIGWGAFYYCTNLTSVTIGTGITSIGSNAFSSCSSLTSVTIPDSVTSVGDFAFSGCTSLTSVIVGNGVTSIGGCAFCDCTSLTSVTIPDSVTRIGGGAFSGCDSLTDITIPDSVNSIGHSAFSDCDSLTGVYITDIAAWCGIAFENSDSNPLCYAKNLYLNNERVTDLVIPDGVTSIGDYAFKNCSSLTSVTVPESLASIGVYAFEDCTGLTGVYITDMEAWCAIELGPANLKWGSEESNPLYYAKKLYLNNELVTELVIPDGVTEIQDYLFYDCDDLISVTIPDSVTSIGKDAFGGCNSLASVTIGSGVTSIGTDAFWHCDSLTGVYITDIAAWCGVAFGAYNANPLSNGTSLYLNNELVTDLTIPDSVTSVGYDAFFGCTSLTSVTIPDSVTRIGGGAFHSCRSLTNVSIGSGVTSIDMYTFYGCSSLQSINIPDSITSIAYRAFSYSSCQTNVYITDLAAWCNIAFDDTNSNPLYGGGNLYLMDELVTELVFPDDITEIRDYTFYDCISLTNVTIPDSITSIGSYAFSGCDSLTDITIPDSVTSIGSYAFSGCTSLASVTIPDSVTVIAGYTFFGCGSLQSITIPESITSLGENAFKNCTALTEINFNATAMDSPSSGDNVFAYAGHNGDGITVNIGANVTKIPARLFQSCINYMYESTPKIISINFEEGSVCQSIGAAAFYHCTSLTDVTIPESVTSIGSSAFYYCYGLTGVYITDLVAWCGIEFGNPGANPLGDAENLYLNNELVTELVIPEGVTAIGNYMFYNCSSLSSVTIPDSVTSIGKEAFYSCDGFTSITIPENITSIGENAFGLCTTLTEINFNATAMNDLSTGTFAFDRAGKYGDGVTVNIGANVTKIPAYLFQAEIGRYSQYIPQIISINFEEGSVCQSIGAYAFYYCTSLTDVTIPDSITSIGDYAFYNCTALEEINFNATAMNDTNGRIFEKAGTEGEGITVNVGANVTKIPASLFRPDYSSNAPKIVSIKFADDSVCQSIGDYAFHYCASLTTVILPVSTTSIGNSAFGGCQNFWHTLYKGTETQWAEITIGSNNTYLTDAIIHYNCKGDEVQDPVQKVCSVCCPHTYEVTATTQPTCTEPGTTTYACTACGYSYTKEDIPATGHSYETTVISAPTCTEAGATQYVCTVCGHAETKETPATGHNYVGGCAVDVVPTEKTEGHLTGVCVVCSAPVEATLPVLNMVDYTFTLVTTATEDTPATGRFTWNEKAYGEFYFDVSLRYGDVNGDGYVDGRDVVQLRKYMANYDYDTHTSTELVYAGADANGDGQINGQDVVLLRKYMANYDYDTGKSTIVLGP